MKEKKKYTKPVVTYRDKVDVMAAVCDSSWIPNRSCQVMGQPSCQKVR